MTANAGFSFARAARYLISSEERRMVAIEKKEAEYLAGEHPYQYMPVATADWTPVVICREALEAIPETHVKRDEFEKRAREIVKTILTKGGQSSVDLESKRALFLEGGKLLSQHLDARNSTGDRLSVLKELCKGKQVTEAAILLYQLVDEDAAVKGRDGRLPKALALLEAAYLDNPKLHNWKYQNDIAGRMLAMAGARLGNGQTYTLTNGGGHPVMRYIRQGGVGVVGCKDPIEVGTIFLPLHYNERDESGVIAQLRGTGLDAPSSSSFTVMYRICRDDLARLPQGTVVSARQLALSDDIGKNGLDQRIVSLRTMHEGNVELGIYTVPQEGLDAQKVVDWAAQTHKVRGGYLVALNVAFSHMQSVHGLWRREFATENFRLSDAARPPLEVFTPRQT